MIKILVVDDDKNICELIKIYFEEYGGEFFFAHDIPQAISLLRGHKFSIVVTDLNLVTGQGDSLIRYMRMENSAFLKIPIVVISGERSFDCSQYEKCIFLEKPFSEELFLEAVRSVFPLKFGRENSHRNEKQKQQQVHPHLKKILSGRKVKS